MGIAWPTIPPPGAGTALGADLVHITLALPTAGDVWDSARWDTATWDALDYDNFVDASCDAHGVAIDRGRSDPLGHIQPARCRFTLDDPTGLYSPWNTVDLGGNDLLAPVLGPDTPVRVATHAGPLFTGWVRSSTETDDDADAAVAVDCTDALSFLGDANGYEQASQGAGETAGPRLGRIMNAAQVPALVDRALSAGVTPLQATTLAKGALEEAWLVADSDGGVFWATPAGVLRYVDPVGLEAPEFTEPAAHFTDDLNEAAGTLCPVSFTVANTRDNVKNVVAVAFAGGTAVSVADSASVARHGARTTQRFDLIHQDAGHSARIAQSMLARLAGADLTLSPIEGVPTDDPDWFATAHALDIGHRVEVSRTRWGQQLHALGTIDAITHTITLDGWTMTVRCSPGTQVKGYSHWDTARWDVDYWDRRP